MICEFPNHPHGVIPAEYRGRLYEDDRSNPYRILRVWVKASEEKTQRTRMHFYLSYMALATAMAPVAGRADVVVATTPPLFTGVAGLALARLNRAPFVLDVRDLWPAAAVSLMQIRHGRTLRRRRVARADALPRGGGGRRRDAAVLRAHRPDPRRTQPPTTLIPNGTLELFLDAQPEATAASALGADDERVPRHLRRHARDRAGRSTRSCDAAPLLDGEASLRARRRRPDEGAARRSWRPSAVLTQRRRSTRRCRSRRRRRCSRRATLCSSRSPRTRPSATSFPRS